MPVEGPKPILELSEKHPIELLLFSEKGRDNADILMTRARQWACLSDDLLQKLSSVRAHQGFVAFFQKPQWQKEDLSSRLLYCHRLQDPGNLGTLLRSMSATGGFSLISGPESVSCFNPKVVRASAGMLFTTPFLEEVSLETLREWGYQLWAADPTHGISLFSVVLKPPFAVILGSEGQGLPKLEGGVRRLYIPMRPECNSLNAAVAGSLILYEVFRRENT